MLLGEPEALLRAAINLLDNAVRHACAAVQLRFDLTDGAVRIAVIDDGAGLSPERAITLFDRFGPVTRGGAGLGLAYVATVAARHGGRACYEPVEPAGACFVMEWPVM